MKQFKTVFAAAMLLVVGTGCFRHAYKVGAGAEAKGTPSYSTWQHNILWGLIGGADVDVKKICPSGNAYIQNYFSVVDSIITMVLGGFWSPTTVEVYCGDRSRSEVGAPAHKVVLSEEAMRRIANDVQFSQLVEAVAPQRVHALNAARVSTPGNALTCR